MPLGNWEGWRSNEAEPEELPDYFYTMPAKDSQRIEGAFLLWAKSVFCFISRKNQCLNKEAAAALFAHIN